MELNFGGISEAKEPDFLVLPIPYSYTSSYGPSVREGPERILLASRNLEAYDEESLFPLEDLKIKTFPFLEPTAAGPEAMIERIETHVAKIYEPNQFLISIGGDHTVAIGVVRGLLRFYDRISILVLDGHDDLRDEYESSPISHACVTRRLSELGPVVIIGVRSISTLPQDRPDNVAVLTARELIEGTDFKKIIDKLDDPVYISCDLDVFDPALMPAVGSPEPDGLSWPEVTRIIRYVIKSKKVIGADFVELAPIPGIISPDFITARLIMKTMVYQKTGYA